MGSNRAGSGGSDGRFRFPVRPEGSIRKRRDWPFYLDRHQRALIRRVHEAWGDDAVIQIYGGCVRIRSAAGDWRFGVDGAELQAALARMPAHGQQAGQQAGQQTGQQESGRQTDMTRSTR